MKHKPVPYEGFKDFFSHKYHSEEKFKEEYGKYLKEVEAQKECYNKTRHRNWEYYMGCIFCLDCGADA